VSSNPTLSATDPKHVSSLGWLFIRLGLPRRCCGEDLWTTRAASTLLPFSDGPVFSEPLYDLGLVQSLPKADSRAFAQR
jgi:hypothetical protein